MVGFIIIVALIMGMLIVAVKNIAANRSATAPVHAKVVVVKRTGLYKRATFELDNGVRVSFQLIDAQASMLTEGDTGLLAYYKDIYKSFVRDVSIP